jgi:Zn-dependent protease with chaperone function
MTTTTGSGIFFDGASSERKDVSVELAADALRIRNVRGDILAEWPYAQVEQLSAPEGVLRIGRHGPFLARLEIRDPTFAAALDDMATTVDRSGSAQRRDRLKAVGWGVAAVVSLSTIALFALPEIATRLTPLLPQSVERKLGEAVDAQMRATLGPRAGGRSFECGSGESETIGRAVLQSLIQRLETAAALPTPLRATVIRRGEPNAVALPGGQIYVFEGILNKVESPDEIAGVIAHEIGHVARRDGVRALLQSAGLSFLFGMVLGDFVGGGAVVVAARTLLQSSYSRDTEAAADAYGVALMNKIGGDASALGRILARIAGTHGMTPRILLDHPETQDRVAAIHALAKEGSAKPLLDNAEWAALKHICARQ